jgi:hypothetical protein
MYDTYGRLPSKMMVYGYHQSFRFRSRILSYADETTDADKINTHLEETTTPNQRNPPIIQPRYAS